MKTGQNSSSTSAELGIDYSQYAFTKSFEHEPEGMFPVNFLREFIPGVKKLKPTNRWYVTVMDPKLGICNFYLAKNGRNWTVDKTGLPKSAQIPNKEIINFCSAELTAHLL